MVISVNADREMVISKDDTNTSTNHISNHQHIREVSIAKNKELIRELGLNDFWGKEKDEATGKKGKKDGMEKKDEATETGTR